MNPRLKQRCSQQKVPLAEFDHTLRTIATSFKQLQGQLQRFTSEDPAVQSLRQRAQQALEADTLSEAESLLRQAQLQDLEAIQQQQETLKDRKRSAAATSTALGALKQTELAYAAAAAYYQQAADLVPSEDIGTQAAYLNRAGIAWFDAGQYARAQASLASALTLREKVLGPEHPAVATGLNNLAELYRAQGRYREAEPYYQQALAIREKVLRPEHPDVTMVLQNYIAMLHAAKREAEAEKLAARLRASHHGDVWGSIGSSSTVWRDRAWPLTPWSRLPCCVMATSTSCGSR